MTDERPAPVTVAELVKALNTYPPDALVFTGEAGTGCGSIEVKTDRRIWTVWDGVTSAGNWYEGDSPRMLAAYANERPKSFTENITADSGPVFDRVI